MGPLVSICIPTYNDARVITGALRSALTQSYDNVEIWVLDNHSNDDTEQVVAQVSAGDGRVQYRRQSANLGMSRNFSACIEQATGTYVKFICADDALEPECVERMVEVMSAHPQVALVACARQLVDDNLQPAGMARYSRRFVLTGGAAAIRCCFFFGNLIGEPTAVMFRRADAVGGFDAGYRQLMDLEMWLRLLKRGAFAFLPDALCKVRQHAKRATLENLKSGVVLDDKRRFFRAFRDEVEKHASSREKALWDARMGVTLYRTRDVGQAVPLGEIREVFFPRLFSRLTYPAASILWRLFGRDT